MNVDFGLISIFVIEIGLVLAVYHALNKVWAEIRAAKEMKSDLTTGLARLDSFGEQNKLYREEMERWAIEVGDAPAAAIRRVKEAESEIASIRRAVEKVDVKVNSANARMAAAARRRSPKDEDDNETDPAPQGEGSEGLGPLFPPGSTPLAGPAQRTQRWYEKKVGG